MKLIFKPKRYTALATAFTLLAFSATLASAAECVGSDERGYFMFVVKTSDPQAPTQLQCSIPSIEIINPDTQSYYFCPKNCANAANPDACIEQLFADSQFSDIKTVSGFEPISGYASKFSCSNVSGCTQTNQVIPPTQLSVCNIPSQLQPPSEQDNNANPDDPNTQPSPSTPRLDMAQIPAIEIKKLPIDVGVGNTLVHALIAPSSIYEPAARQIQSSQQSNLADAGSSSGTDNTDTANLWNLLQNSLISLNNFLSQMNSNQNNSTSNTTDQTQSDQQNSNTNTDTPNPDDNLQDFLNQIGYNSSSTSNTNNTDGANTTNGPTEQTNTNSPEQSNTQQPNPQNSSSPKYTQRLKDALKDLDFAEMANIGFDFVKDIFGSLKEFVINTSKKVVNTTKSLLGFSPKPASTISQNQPTEIFLPEPPISTQEKATTSNPQQLAQSSSTPAQPAQRQTQQTQSWFKTLLSKIFNFIKSIFKFIFAS